MFERFSGILDHRIILLQLESEALKLCDITYLSNI